MKKWVDVQGAVAESTVYDSKKLVGRSVSFTLPGMEFQTQEIKAMGTMEIPLIGMLNDMELTITKIGVDKGLAKLSRLETHDLEFRWVQNSVDSKGRVTPKGCKAYARTIPSTVPGIGVTPGEAGENEITYKCSMVKVFFDNYEVLAVDRLNQVLRVDGVDYYKDVENLL